MKPIIKQFYEAYANLDAEGMVACYHDDVVFEDPAFGKLKGERAKNAWRMLISFHTNKTLKVTFSDLKMKGEKGYASWEASYVFPYTGRYIHDKINAEFQFKDGKIISHIDSYDFYLWSRKAFGITGYLVGWSYLFKFFVRSKMIGLLDKFEQEQNSKMY